ncbi:Metallo-hydrolase/oxidoreductase [Dichomitus squalens]|uniref:Metallo-hydrolase/oxidoreductase n=1 Tax=Dichomitus squalens TaxID=114155 RepID=A0A4Q9MST6_9APHY|nr:Metallo-hydrolase/oxidoreductase [Dichomitus squalens]
MSLPPPAANQAYIKVSALEGGFVKAPLSIFLEKVPPSEFVVVPSISFLLRHTSRPETFVFDLGIHKHWATLDPALRAEYDALGADMTVPEDVADALRKGNLDPADVTYASISHAHADHIGDPTVFPNATYLLGSEAQTLLDPETKDLGIKLLNALPKERTRFLDLAGAPALGPFPHALDFYGDGSLYIVDAPGHLPGHINVLARTSADGGWIYLAADSVHDWRIMTGEGKISTEPFCIHANKEQAEVTIERIREVNKIPRVRVLLAHDRPWYDLNKGGDAYWPGEIKSL